MKSLLLHVLFYLITTARCGRAHKIDRRVRSDYLVSTALQVQDSVVTLSIFHLSTPPSEQGYITDGRDHFVGSKVNSQVEQGVRNLVEGLSYILENRNHSVVMRVYKYPGTLLEAISAGVNDIGLNMIVENEERRQNVSFLWRNFVIHSEIALRTSSSKGQSDIFLLKPLTSVVIAAISALISLVVIVTSLRPEKLHEVWFLSVSIFSGQATEENMPGGQDHKAGTARVFCLVASAASLLMFTVYSASMASDIATPVSVISNLRDLDREGFQLVYHPKDTIKFPHVHFLAENKTYQAFFNGSDKRAMLVNHDDSKFSFKRVIMLSQPHEKLFCVASSSVINRMMEFFRISKQSILRIRAVDSPSSSRIISFPFPKYSRRNKVLVEGLLKMKESGLMVPIETLWIGPKTPSNTLAESNHVEPVQPFHVRSAFIVWGVGCALAALTCLFEIAIVQSGIDDTLRRKKSSPRVKNTTTSDGRCCACLQGGGCWTGNMMTIGTQTEDTQAFVIVHY